MPVCDFCKQLYQPVAGLASHNCPSENFGTFVGLVAHYVPTKTLVSLAHVSKAGERVLAPTLEPAREMWGHNQAFGQKQPKLKTNFVNEGVAARLLKAICPNYQAWDSADSETKAKLSKTFVLVGDEGKPDYIMTIDGVERVVDCFTVNHPKQGAKTPDTAKRAIDGSFPNGPVGKWEKYGENSGAVAVLEGFPDESVVSTADILGWIHQKCVAKFQAYTGKKNLLFLVRDPLIKRIMIA